MRRGVRNFSALERRIIALEEVDVVNCMILISRSPKS